MTAQEPEILIVDGTKYEMTSCPPPSKENHDYSFRSQHTATYRGYVGVWEIKDDKLYIIDGPEVMEYPVFADWVNQEIHIWNGEELQYVHAGFGSMYEEDIYFSVENGVIVGGRKESNIEKFFVKAKEAVNTADTKDRISYLFNYYLSPDSKLTKLAKSNVQYDLFQIELEGLFKERLWVLSKDPNSGITLVYK